MRWLAVLLASVLLHGIVVDLAGGKIGIPAPAPQALPDHVVSVQLELRQIAPPVAPPAAAPALPVAAPVAAAKPPRPRPKPRLKPHPAPAQPVVRDPGAPVIAESAPPESPLPSDDEMAGMAAPGSSVEPAIVLAPDAGPAAPPEPGQDAGNAALAQKTAPNPPPSALLKYQVQSTKEGKAVYGSGKIAWHTDGSAYAVIGEASVLFFTVLEFRSEGGFDSFGVAPLLYTEKRLRKPATNTHFQREPKVVSFSASTVTYPRQGGEQDRASVIWQLAALGRGNGSLFAPGAGLDVVVAGVRDAETWNIRVIGLESIQTPVGEMQAWHLARQPRATSYDQKIDIWLAPQRQWYPVRLRYTDKNGDYLDMAASAIEPLAPPASRE